MPNSQLFPQQIYPAVGDVSSTPGSASLTVVGIQTTPFSPTKPTDGQVPVYQVATNQWVPSSSAAGNISIEVNSLAYSDDYTVFANYVDISTVQVNSAFPPNGFPILVEGVPSA